MKFLSLIVLFLLSYGAFAGTCTSITRVNVGSSTTLTSAKYNADINGAYNAINSSDGGCIQDGTIESGGLNTTDFDVLLNAPKEGCEITNSGDTLSVAPCRIAVNDNLISTTATSTLDWTTNCSGCSSEATGTQYYLYVKSGTSFSGLISTSAPNNLGYSGTSRILGQFYNDATGDIATYSIYEWHIDGFEDEYQATIPITKTSTKLRWVHCPVALTSAGVLYSTGADCVSSVLATATGVRRITFKPSMFKDRPICSGLAGGGGSYLSVAATQSNFEYVTINIKTDAGAAADEEAFINCFGVGY